ncbi:MAG TPA: flagellar motor protein MotB [Desulfobacterales bacterium]|nr:flagellar motor protein MotB [Desulfobacterales bacterium]
MSDGEKVTIIKKVNKRGGHGGHHGGAWKVAYADFVTAMMALFIVLWIVANNVTVRASVADYFRDPGAMHKTSSGVMNGANSMKPFSDAQPTQPVVPPSQPPQPTGTASPPQQAEVEKLRQEGEKLKQMIAAIPDLSKYKDQIEIKLTKDGLRIELIEQAEGLFFDIGSARLKPDAMQLLKLIATRIGTFPNDVVIEGHTDSRPYTRAGYNNWDLSTDRANSARRVIEESGIHERQITSVNGYADRRLKNPDKPLDYSNRRVTILVAFSTALASEPKAIAPAAAPLVQKPIIVGRN